MSETTSSPASEFVTFIQHQLPGLEAGSYELGIGQRVDDSDGQPISGDTLGRSYAFAVTGDRFRLSNPSATVASTFPASNATGEYSTALAHVVFAAPSFPWIRSAAKVPPPLPAPGKDADADVPTWLAVLVLDDDDAAAYPALTLDPVTGVARRPVPARGLRGEHARRQLQLLHRRDGHPRPRDRPGGRRSRADDRHTARAVRGHSADAGRPQAERPCPPGVGGEQAGGAERPAARRPDRQLRDRRRQPPPAARHDAATPTWCRWSRWRTSCRPPGRAARWPATPWS